MVAELQQEQNYGSIVRRLSFDNNNSNAFEPRKNDSNDDRQNHSRAKVGAFVLLTCCFIFMYMVIDSTSRALHNVFHERNKKSIMMMQKSTTVSENNKSVRVVPASPSGEKTTTTTRIEQHDFDTPANYDNDKEAVTPLYYTDQLVDHFANDNNDAAATWSNRYYMSTRYCPDNAMKQGGNTILWLVGGEDDIDRILYPFVTYVLAKDLKACVVQQEHRFYGESQPIAQGKIITVEDMNQLLSPEQALADNVRLLRYLEKEVWGCSNDPTSNQYCPVITIGGSYPGFLSAMMKLVYPEDVDISYASSAPLKVYSQQVHHEAYFEKITLVAEQASPGCAPAVKETSMGLQDAFLEYYNDNDNFDDSNNPIHNAAQDMNICVNTFPKYITNVDIMVQEMQFLIGTSFADMNMDYYPPNSEDLDIVEACQIFQDENKTHIQKMRGLFDLKLSHFFSNDDCYDLRNEYPWEDNAGHHPTISASDWSGVGDDVIWEYLTCSKLIVQAGFSQQSMFGTRPWNLEWLNDHCYRRFGILPQPRFLADRWNFDDLRNHPNASNILFVNGMNDGWSVASHIVDLSETIKAINLPNGAHHSELRYNWKPQEDTEDVGNAQRQIPKILKGWIQDIKATA